MRWDLTKYPLAALPILGGQFLFDLTDKGFGAALRHLPMRAFWLGLIIGVVCLVGWAIRRRKRRFR
ncbi:MULTISPECIES: hypothetical protein [unclassified Caulobacter]|uniref:hypothetical protein n=1 Tax=unclassified Caulobacter TaxID=2648921 RepID=UPI0011B6146A|nr:MULTISPECIES: hypothetical protein [unclassified Caulobacter]